MASEQFSLCWDNFHRNMSEGMQSLFNNEDLVDVTLAAEGRYLKAHKMVLAVCSRYFKDLFQSNPCKHPIVYMKDVSYNALRDLLQFMYQGEVLVAQENLAAFIKTAESLQIKGLADDDNNSETETDIEQEKPLGIDEEQMELSKSVINKPKKTLVGPSSKRMKLQEKTVLETNAETSPVATKSEVPVVPSTQEIIQFKMEPPENPSVDSDNPEHMQIRTNKLNTSRENTPEDTEDYALIETCDEEPHPSTSGDAAEEGQDESYSEKTVSRQRWCRAVETGGFTYHQNSSKHNRKIRYLVCSEYKRLVCRARAILPADGTVDELIVTRGHNHPPNKYSVDFTKNRFVNSLKRLISSSPKMSLRDIYIFAKELDPEGSALIPYNKAVSSMRRWRMKEQQISTFPKSEPYSEPY